MSTPIKNTHPLTAPPAPKRKRRTFARIDLAAAPIVPPGAKCQYCNFDAFRTCSACERHICADCVGGPEWLHNTLAPTSATKCANCASTFRPHTSGMQQRIAELEQIVKDSKEQIAQLEKSLLDPKVAAEVLADLCGCK